MKIENEQYEELFGVKVAGVRVILAGFDSKYVVCDCRRDSDSDEYSNVSVHTDYLDAMLGFTQRVEGYVTDLKKERAMRSLPIVTLTEKDCIPGGMDGDITGKLIVLNPEYMSSEFRTSDYQLKICTGGFGAKENARGKTVFCTDLYTGNTGQFKRQWIAGVIDPDKMPAWAKDKMAERHAHDIAFGAVSTDTFENGGYHFAPYRTFYKGEIDKRLENDSRTWKMDAHYQMRNMKSDRTMGLTKREWKKADYSYDGFYAASGGSGCDIFRCLENGKLYVPCANELFQYIEPPHKERAAFAMKNGRRTYSEPDGEKPVAVFLQNDERINDKIYGRWLSLPADADSLRDTLSRIGVKDGKYSIIAAKSVYDDVDTLLSTSAGIDELNMLAHFMKGMEEWELNKLEAILHNGVPRVNNVADLINLLDEDNFKGVEVIEVYTHESLGRYRECIGGGVLPEGMTYTEYGAECEDEEKGALTDLGYVYQRFAAESFYTGDVPDEYRIADAAIVSGQKRKPQNQKKSVLTALSESNERAARDNAACAEQRNDLPPRRRGGQVQGD